jgi:hypothetical protein
MTGCIGAWAQISPVAAVKTTRDMTRGLSSWTKSCQRAGDVDRLDVASFIECIESFFHWSLDLGGNRSALIFRIETDRGLRATKQCQKSDVEECFAFHIGNVGTVLGDFWDFARSR